MESGPGVAGQLGYPPLNGRMHVLVGLAWKVNDPSVISASVVSSASSTAVASVLRHQAHPGQHPDVGPRAGDVISKHPPVEGQAVVEGLEGLVGATLETVRARAWPWS